MSFIKALGSLTFALILIGALALTLTVSTTLESLYGTPFAQRFFYQAGWFDVFLGLLAVNIVCSAASRFPFKKRHTGFVITHIGIFFLLIGSLLSRLFGVDGQMMLFEGGSKDHVLENRYELFIRTPSGAAAYDLVSGGSKKPRLLARINGESRLHLARTWENAVVDTQIKEGSDSDSENHAIELTLSSDLAGFKDTFWLSEKNPADPDSQRLSLGPATVELREKSTASFPTLRVAKKDGGGALDINLTDIPNGEITVPGTDLRIVRILYYPDARVEDNKLVTVSESPDNPAVEFDVQGAGGRRKHYVKFALFPEFESMHGKNPGDEFGLATEFIAPSVEPKTGSPTLYIYTGRDGWSYESRSSRSSASGQLEAGQTYQTGWMDFSFRVEHLLNRAIVSKDVKPAEGGAKGQIAAEITLARQDKVLAQGWATEENPLRLPLGESGEILVTVRPRNRPVPFLLTLKDFRKIDYPGTNRAASYESDVRLHDTAEHATIEKTIRMNQPLDHKGYRIFQSSYVQDPSVGEASVFTVAKNPGILLIYSGACVLFLGSFLVFFVPAFSSLKLKENS